MYFQYRVGKLIADNIRPDEQNKEFWEAGEYDKVFPNWKKGDILYIGDVPLKYPIEENKKIREMTDIELIKEGIKKLLEGQYISGDEIITKEIPSNLLKAVWNNEENIWEEGASKEEFIELRKNKILKYSRLKKEREELASSGFAIQEEIDSIDKQLEEYKIEIDELEIKIKSM